jgi:patatin-like phospholipase/acyl hydrolase
MIKRILSIDGGGILGVFPASFLANIEKHCKINVREYFDLIVGTSTGGIIALGIGLGLSCSEILSFYQALGPKIFDRNFIYKHFKGLTKSRYSSEKLRESIENVFDNRRLSDSTVRLAIPAMRKTDAEPYVFKTAHHESYKRDYQRSAIEVALATSAAPTFFESFMSTQNVPLIDGGLWANNPACVGAIESIGVLKWPAEEVHILSIGTTKTPLKIQRKMDGYIWGNKIINTFMRAQSCAAINQAQLIVGRENFHRIDPFVTNHKLKLDSTKYIELLVELAADEERKHINALEPVFFSEKAELFKPVYR